MWLLLLNKTLFMLFLFANINPTDSRFKRENLFFKLFARFLRGDSRIALWRLVKPGNQNHDALFANPRNAALNQRQQQLIFDGILRTR